MIIEIETIVSGIFSCIFIVISLGVGIRITLTYRKQKERMYLLVGIAWILMTESWWPSAISFLIAISTDGVGLYELPQIYFIIGNVLMPLNQSLWLIAITDLFYKEKQKIILIIYNVIAIPCDIILVVFSIINPASIGNLDSQVDVDYEPLVMLWIVINLVIWILPGLLFARASLKSDNPEHKLKGKMLILAFILFGIGGVLDSAQLIQVATYVVTTRIILIVSAICYLGGFVLPEWMKKILVRNK